MAISTVTFKLPDTTTVRLSEYSQKAIQKRADKSIKHLVSVEDQKYMTMLRTNYFDSSLWIELVNAGAVNHHEVLLHEKITPGHLWVQQNLNGSVVHWSSDKKIFKAWEHEKKVKIVSYQIHNGNAKIDRYEMKRTAFRDSISSYLSKGADPRPLLEAPKWDEFVHKIELVRITCCISETASKKMKEFELEYPKGKLGFGIIFLLKDKKGVDHVMIEVSKHALFRFSKEDGPHLVAPSLRSFEALEQIDNKLDYPDLTQPSPKTENTKKTTEQKSELQKPQVLTFSQHQHDNLSKQVNHHPIHHDQVRSTLNLRAINRTAEREIEQLKPALHLRKDAEISWFPFTTKVVDGQGKTQGFLITVDYVDEKFVLESTYHKPSSEASDADEI